MDLSLIALLDTLDFRNRLQWRGRPSLEALAAGLQSRPSVHATEPTRLHSDTGGTPVGEVLSG